MAESTRDLPRVGIIGLDPMGVAVAQRLATKCMVFVYDKSQARRDDAAFNNLAACTTPWDLAVAADTILVNLHGTETQRELIEKDMLRGLAAGKRILLLNPLDLPEVRRMAKDLEAKGIFLMDALISGNETRARDGNLCIYVAGAKDQCKKAAHIFKLLGGQGKVMFCGSVGAAQIVKSVEILAMALGHAAFLEALASHVETFLATGQPPYPAERTQLTGGILDYALESRVKESKRLDTPDLDIRYDPPADSGFMRGDYAKPVK